MTDKERELLLMVAEALGDYLNAQMPLPDPHTDNLRRLAEAIVAVCEEMEATPKELVN